MAYAIACTKKAYRAISGAVNSRSLECSGIMRSAVLVMKGGEREREEREERERRERERRA